MELCPNFGDVLDSQFLLVCFYVYIHILPFCCMPHFLIRVLSCVCYSAWLPYLPSKKKKTKKKTKQNKAKEKQKTRLLFSYIIFYISVLVAFYFFGSFLTQTLTPHFPLPPHTYLPPVLRTWDISRHTSETLFLANARRV